MPTANDVGYYLRAMVTYKDGEGTGKSAMATSMHPVQAIRVAECRASVPRPEGPRHGSRHSETSETRTGARERGRGYERGRARQSRRRQQRHTDPHANWRQTRAPSRSTRPPGRSRLAPILRSRRDEECGQQCMAFTVLVVATDPAGKSAVIAVTINAKDDDDEPPAITGVMSTSVAENATDLDIRHHLRSD